MGLFHETNTFAPGRTGFQDFSHERVEGNPAFISRYEHTRTSMGGVIDSVRAEHAELVCGMYSAATPSGLVSKEAIEKLFDGVIGSMDSSVDGIIAILHGAMVAEGMFDVEGELLARIRERVGHKPICTTIDLHANENPYTREWDRYDYG